MATSGTINGSFNGSNAQYLTFRCDWEVISQDKANKTSTVGLKWIVTKTTGNLNTFKQSAPWSQVCDGTTTSGTLNFNLGNVSANTDYVVRETSVVIQHEVNGTKTASISGTLNLSGTSAGTGSFSGSMALPTIATAPPTGVSVSVSDMWSGKPASISAYVGGYTIFKLTASATAVSPATIASYSFYNGATLLQTGSSSTFTYSSPNSAGSYSFKVVVTDSYGNSTTSSAVSATVVQYSTPVLTATAYRCTSGGTADSSGTYLYLGINYTFASNITGNTATCKTVVGGNTYTWTLQSAHRIESGFPASNSYNAVTTVTDTIGGRAVVSILVTSQFRNFDLYPDATNGGAAFGEVAQQGKMIINHPETILRGKITLGSTSLTEAQLQALLALI